jgi:hypothetical protein
MKNPPGMQKQEYLTEVENQRWNPNGIPMTGFSARQRLGIGAMAS